ncbi:MAG: DUF1559 domain-containing protein, partial [Aeoliella sp.]
PWAGSTLLSMDFHPEYYGPTRRDDPPNDYIFEANSGSLGLTQVPNGSHPDVLYECVNESSAQLEGMPCNAAFNGYISAAPRSMHTGGVTAGFVDGHVEFLSEDVDEFVMLYLIGVSDGQVIPER